MPTQTLPVSSAQRRAITELQRAVQDASSRLNTYLLAVLDGHEVPESTVPDRLTDDGLVVTVPDITPASEDA